MPTISGARLIGMNSQQGLSPAGLHAAKWRRFRLARARDAATSTPPQPRPWPDTNMPHAPLTVLL
jgi:hypothetical protein